MNLLQRLARICKADFHGLMDRFEDKELLLKQYIRDMAVALLQKEGLQKRLSQSRHAAAQKLANTDREIEKLEQDLEMSLKHNKDNIARHLIRKLKPIMALRSQNQRHLDNLDHEMAQFQASIDQQRQQFEQVKLRAAECITCSKQTELYTALPEYVTAHFSQELSDEDVEQALKQRKQAIFQN